MDVFGVEPLAQCGGADDVEEQHGDLLEGLLGRAGGRFSHREAGPQLSECGVDDGVAEHGALRIEARDQGFELLLWRGHGVLFRRAGRGQERVRASKRPQRGRSGVGAVPGRRLAARDERKQRLFRLGPREQQTAARAGRLDLGAGERHRRSP